MTYNCAASVVGRSADDGEADTERGISTVDMRAVTPAASHVGRSSSPRPRNDGTAMKQKVTPMTTMSGNRHWWRLEFPALGRDETAK